MRVRDSVEKALVANLEAFGDEIVLISPLGDEHEEDATGEPLLGVVEDATKVIEIGIDGEAITARLSVTIPTHILPVPVSHPSQSKRKWRVRIGLEEHLVEAIYPDRTVGITTFALSLAERVKP